MVVNISFPDYLETHNIAFEWAESYDTKDWVRLRKVLGPAVSLDFRPFKGPLREGLSPDDFVAFISDKAKLGNPCLKTQHFLGASNCKQLDDGRIEVSYQIRVTHQRYVAEDLAEVAAKGHLHGSTEHVYEKIDGAWKLVGITPKPGWYEDDFMGTVRPKEA